MSKPIKKAFGEVFLARVLTRKEMLKNPKIKVDKSGDLLGPEDAFIDDMNKYSNKIYKFEVLLDHYRIVNFTDNNTYSYYDWMLEVIDTPASKVLYGVDDDSK